MVKPKIFRVGLLLIVPMLYLFVGGEAGAADNPKSLAGPAFSDPAKLFPMKQKWVKQPVKYTEKTGKVDIALDLNQQLFEFVEPLAREYAKKNNLKISVNFGTCGTSSAMLTRKAVDIGGFCCPPGEVDRLPGLKFHTLGLLPMGIVVHRDNPVDSITLDQVQKIYQGDIYRWSKLGGKHKPIKTFGATHCKIRPGHWRLLIDSDNNFTPRFKPVAWGKESILSIINNPQAVAWETLLSIKRYGKGKVKALKVDGRHPSELNKLISGEYPLYRTFSVTTWTGKDVENPHAQKLVAYLIKGIEAKSSQIGLVSASQLRKAGWKFKENELIGEPL
ncbi:MAG: hypothetical protein HQL69_01760 [Magnetococcales bacterium]|nr:hypothetical protein [Magnetococcales bacterium]